MTPSPLMLADITLSPISPSSEEDFKTQMLPLFVSNNPAVEGSPLWALLQGMLLSKASVGEVGVWLDGRVSKHSWWLHGDSQGVGCVVKRGRPIGATREGHVFQLFLLLASGTRYSTPLHCTAPPPLTSLLKAGGKAEMLSKSHI